MKPLLLPLLIPLLFCSCSTLKINHPSRTPFLGSQGDSHSPQTDPSAVSHAVTNAKIRVTLSNPSRMGEEATFAQLKPFLMLSLESRPSDLASLEQAAGKKILSLGPYPFDFMPEDTLVYAH